MRPSLSTRQLGTLRVLTLVCFFHFSGLNNGFTFFAAAPSALEPMGFAPVAIRSIAYFVSPFQWKRLLGSTTIKSSIFSSQRVLEISSRRALRNMRSQSGLIQAWIRAGMGKPLSPLEPAPERQDQSSGAGSNQTGGAPSGQNMRTDFSESSLESWHKSERMDILQGGRSHEILFQPSKEKWNSLKESIESRLKAEAFFPLQARRPAFHQRVHYPQDSEDGGPNSKAFGHLLISPLSRGDFYFAAPVIPAQAGIHQRRDEFKYDQN